MSEQQRASFGGKLSVILVAAGSAIGLGSIWRFPYMAGENGGAAFLLVYLLCVFVVGIPVMLGEFAVGRKTQMNAVGGFRALSRPWRWLGYTGVLCAMLISGYYYIVAGWSLEYLFSSFGPLYRSGESFSAQWEAFQLSPRQAIYTVAFVLLTHIIIARGVEKGIERFSKVLMPLLLLIIFVLIGFSISMPNASTGISFLLKPDFSKVTKDVILSAMGQAFFTLSVGIGTLATYASYFNKETKLVKTALGVCAIDTMVAVSAGFIIFPALFSVGVDADSGPGLVFITLPYVFNEAFGNMPVLEYIFSALFYVLLVLAALTSTISMHEIGTAYIHETFKLTRPKAAMVVTAICLTFGIICSLSFGLWKEVTVMGMTFFDLFDFITAKFLMPLGGLLICTFVGWDMNKKLVASELNSRFTPLLMILFSWVAPIGIGIIFVYGLISG